MNSISVKGAAVLESIIYLDKRKKKPLRKNAHYMVCETASHYKLTVV
jgi:hypothetical protein